MRTTKAAVARHTMPAPPPADIEECPVADARLERELRASVAASKDLARGILAFLGPFAEEAQARWVKRAVDAGGVVFQPWAMEILFALAVQRRARFSELQRLLHVSSRTLSDKLQVLREAGLVERQVFDEQPVRIEYFLTKEGRDASSVATTLFTLLNVQASRRA